MKVLPQHQKMSKLQRRNGTGDQIGWVEGWLGPDSPEDATNVSLLKAPKGMLWNYNESLEIYKCPADRSTVSIGGRLHPRVRSVSMNGNMNGNSWYTERIKNTHYTYRKYGEIITPSPSQAFVLPTGTLRSGNGLIQIPWHARLLPRPAVQTMSLGSRRGPRPRLRRNPPTRFNWLGEGGEWTYEKTGPDTARLVFTHDEDDSNPQIYREDVILTYTTRTSGSYRYSEFNFGVEVPASVGTAPFTLLHPRPGTR